MARAVTSHAPERCSKYEPLYEIDPHTGACIEVFYADGVLAKSFGIRGTGWCWWTCEPGCLPGPVSGPFSTSYRAYRNALISKAGHRCANARVQFGSRTTVRKKPLLRTVAPAAGEFSWQIRN